MKTQTFSAILTALCGAALGCGGVAPGEGDEIATTQSALSVDTWTDNVKIVDQASKYPPALAAFGGKLHMVHNGSSKPTHLWYSTFNGTSWSKNVRIYGHYASGPPALAVYQNMLHIAYRKAGTNDLYMAVSYDGGSTWSGAKKAVPTRSAPSLAVFGDKLYMSYCAPTSKYEGNNWARVEVWDGFRWRREDNLRVGGAWLECKGTAIARVGDKLRLVYNYVDAPWFWKDTYYMGESVWTPGENPVVKEFAHKSSKSPPAIVVCNGYAHLVHSGESSNKLYWSYQYSWAPTGWTGDVAIPGQYSKASAALGCYYGRAIMVHPGNTSNQLWWSSFYARPRVASWGTAVAR